MKKSQVIIVLAAMFGFLIGLVKSTDPSCIIPPGKFDGQVISTNLPQPFYGNMCASAVQPRDLIQKIVMACLPTFCCSEQAQCTCTAGGSTSNTCKGEYTTLSCYSLITQRDFTSYSCCEGFIEDEVHVCRSKYSCDFKNGGCDQLCKHNDTTNQDYCACNPGYERYYDGTSARCIDVDECATPANNNTCAPIGACFNTVASFYCTCPVGFLVAPTNQSCIDVDECSTLNGECSDTCINTPGSFSCSCPSGFKLDSDNRNCIDVNECSTSNGGCVDICTNTMGRFSCSCRSGYNLASDARSCNGGKCGINNGCNGTCMIGVKGNTYCNCSNGTLLRDDQECSGAPVASESKSSSFPYQYIIAIVVGIVGFLILLLLLILLLWFCLRKRRKQEEKHAMAFANGVYGTSEIKPNQEPNVYIIPGKAVGGGTIKSTKETNDFKGGTVKGFKNTCFDEDEDLKKGKCLSDSDDENLEGAVGYTRTSDTFEDTNKLKKRSSKESEKGKNLEDAVGFSNEKVAYSFEDLDKPKKTSTDCKVIYDFEASRDDVSRVPTEYATSLTAVNVPTSTKRVSNEYAHSMSLKNPVKKPTLYMVDPDEMALSSTQEVPEPVEEISVDDSAIQNAEGQDAPHTPTAKATIAQKPSTNAGPAPAASRNTERRKATGSRRGINYRDDGGYAEIRDVPGMLDGGNST